MELTEFTTFFGIPATSLLFTLKVIEILNWDWVWIVAPIWIPGLLFGGFILTIMMIAIIGESVTTIAESIASLWKSITKK